MRKERPRETGFVGYLLDKDTDAYKTIMTFSDKLKEIFGKNFKQQIYLHTTMIYLSKMYRTDTLRLLQDNYFRDNINKFKGSICVFDKIQFIKECLVLVYKFKDPILPNILTDLTNRYERFHHARYLHITIGSLNNGTKREFLKKKNP